MKRKRSSWLARTGFRRSGRKTRYVALETNGIARSMLVKAITRLSIPVVTLTPVPQTSVTVNPGDFKGITRTGFSIYNPFPDTTLDYSINNYTLLNTMYDKYSIKGLKLSVEFRIFATTSIAFGNCYIVAQEWSATAPTRMEDIMRYKYVTRKPYRVSASDNLATIKLKLYLTPKRFLGRAWDSTYDEVPTDADYSNTPRTIDTWNPYNSFQFAVFVDNNGATAAAVRANCVQTYWLSLKKPPVTDYLA